MSCFGVLVVALFSSSQPPPAAAAPECLMTCRRSLGLIGGVNEPGGLETVISSSSGSD